MKKTFIYSNIVNNNLKKILNKYKRFKLIGIYTKEFKDKELSISIKEININKKIIIIIYFFTGDINKGLIKLYLILDALIRNLYNIVLVMPYLCYSRQDRKINNSCISAKVIASIFDLFKIKCILTFELHSKQIEGFYKTPLIEISSFMFYIKIINKNFSIRDTIIIFPDSGSFNRVKQYKKYIKYNIYIYNKERYKNKVTFINNINKSYNNGIIIDDIVDSGRTIFKLTKLVSKNIKNIYVFATHAILSAKNFINDLSRSRIKRMFFLNTFNKNIQNNKIYFFDIYKIIFNKLFKII